MERDEEDSVESRGVTRKQSINNELKRTHRGKQMDEKMAEWISYGEDNAEWKAQESRDGTLVSRGMTRMQSEKQRDDENAE